MLIHVYILIPFFAENVCALLLLLYSIHPSNVTKKGVKAAPSSRQDTESYLIQFRATGTDVKEVAKAVDSKKFTQPFLLALGPNSKPTEFFIVTEYLSIPAGRSIVEAFDRLFKLHYVLDLHFARPLQTFFNLFQNVVYDVGTEGLKPQLCVIASYLQD